MVTLAYVKCSSFSLMGGKDFQTLPVREFSNLGLQSTPSTQITGTTKGATQRDSTPGPVTTLNPTIVLSLCDSKLVYNWFAGINGFGKSVMSKQDLILNGYDDQSQMVVSFNIKQCFPIKYLVSTMKAGDSELLSETIELVVEQIERVL